MFFFPLVGSKQERERGITFLSTSTSLLFISSSNYPHYFFLYYIIHKIRLSSWSSSLSFPLSLSLFLSHSLALSLSLSFSTISTYNYEEKSLIMNVMADDGPKKFEKLILILSLSLSFSLYLTEHHTSIVPMFFHCPFCSFIICSILLMPKHSELIFVGHLVNVCWRKSWMKKVPSC